MSINQVVHTLSRDITVPLETARSLRPPEVEPEQWPSPWYALVLWPAMQDVPAIGELVGVNDGLDKVEAAGDDRMRVAAISRSPVKIMQAYWHFPESEGGGCMIGRELSYIVVGDLRVEPTSAPRPLVLTPEERRDGDGLTPAERESLEEARRAFGF